MNQRLQNEEIRLVSEQYAENELYKAIASIGPKLEAEQKEFALCPEECFVETIEFLFAITEKGDAILPNIENCWLRKYNEYKRFDRNVCDDEIRKAVGIVFGFAILAIDSSRHSFYRYTLPKLLTQTVASHKFDNWTGTFDSIFSVPLPDGWLDDFIVKGLDNGGNVSKPFGKAASDNELEIIYNGLMEHKMLCDNPSLADFVYWITGRGSRPQVPLKWAQKNVCRYFVQFYLNSDWSTAEQCFSCNRGSIKGLSQATNITEDNKKIIDEILKEASEKGRK